MSCYGIADVPRGLCNEFSSLAKKMKSEQWWPFVKQACGTLKVTGHSLGGDLAQLLVASLNKKGDPHGADVTADYLYTTGSDPIAKAEVTNDKRADGCFAGKNIWAASLTTKQSLFGLGHTKNITSVDISFNFEKGKLKVVKADKVIAFGPSSWVVAPCGTDLPPIHFDKESWELHKPPAYHARIRPCVSIQ